MSDGKGSVARNAAGVAPASLAGAIIAGFDVHMRQITFDCLDSQTGEVTRGRIASEPLETEGMSDCLTELGPDVDWAVRRGCLNHRWLPPWVVGPSARKLKASPAGQSILI